MCSVCVISVFNGTSLGLAELVMLYVSHLQSVYQTEQFIRLNSEQFIRLNSLSD